MGDAATVRVLWVHGPAGVGKSTTAWQVLERLAPGEPTAYVDIDQLGMLVPAPDGEDEWAWAHRLKARALAAVAPVYAAHGATTLVVSGVLDPGLLGEYDVWLAAHDLGFVRLAVALPELRRRMAARGADAEDWADVEAEARDLEEAALPHPVVVPEGPPDRVAAEVLDRARFVPLRPREARPDDLPGLDGTRAVLVTGAEAVGKSTVAWSAFASTWEGTVPTAFVDLRQLGFLGPAGGPVDHRLQAATTGAVWPVFRRAGARMLFLNGVVDDLDLVADYERVLEGTPLTAVRLAAGPGAVAERVRARARGEGARLAGDHLVGLPGYEVDDVVRRSLRTQEATLPHPDVTDLDTSDLTVDEAGAAVLSAARCRAPGRA
ncbi:AAA family ATPase [Nocardioides taihuensis]|uniref:AAA family ATPase n=1 Tax=Nocardioides taihuensis TaxID=1835606 RepID=A0ABW0BPR0_9ACTN